MNTIKSFFKIDERGTTLKTEILAGLSTFLTMMYILPVNANMLSTFNPELYGQFFLATALAAAVATLIMGLIANLPLALAPGMGINAFFTFTVVLTVMDYYDGSDPYAAIGFALASVFISGIVFLILTVTGLRTLIVKSIPSDLNHAVGAGIGFFIAFVGLKNAGLVALSTETFVTFGQFTNPATLFAFVGIILGMILYVRGNNFAIIITLFITAAAGLVLGLIFPEFIEFTGSKNLGNAIGFVDVGEIGFQNFKELGLSDIFGLCFKYIGDVLTSPVGYFAIFTFLFIDFFDTTGTLIAVGTEADLIDESGFIVSGNKALVGDSVGTVVGSILGVSTTTTFMESVVGVKQGAKTGLSAVVVSCLFLLSIVLYPVFAVFNQPVTAIALVLVGIMMSKQLKSINWDEPAVAVSSFVVIIFMILTYSVYMGIVLGFVTYVILKISVGKGREVSPVMYGIVVISIVFLVLETLNSLGMISF